MRLDTDRDLTGTRTRSSCSSTSSSQQQSHTTTTRPDRTRDTLGIRDTRRKTIHNKDLYINRLSIVT